MPSFIKCNKIMRWWLILLVLLVTSTSCKSWESSSDSNHEDSTFSEDRTEGRKYAYSSTADEGAESLDNDDTAYLKTAEQKVTESLESLKPLGPHNLVPGDISLPTEKVFFTTDHLLPNDVILKGDRSFPDVDNLAGRSTTDNGFPSDSRMPTFPRPSAESESTNKDSPAKTEVIGDGGVTKNDSSSTIKSESVRTKKYEKTFSTNHSETTLAPFNDSRRFYKRKSQEFTFWRDMKHPNTTRRMFGGTPAGPDAAQGRAVALLDDAGQVHCSGAALTRLWVLTVAHCLSKSLTLVLAAYDLRQVPINSLYTHRYYKNEMRAAEEGGLAVSSLQHDIGLAEVTRELHLPKIPPLNQILADMQKHFVNELNGQEVSVFGFGRKEGVAQGAELFSIRTTMTPCGSRAWVPCICSKGNKGVCVGDSGGPVFYKDAQVAITSLGPMACSPSDGHASVFTTLQTYVPLLRSTVPAMPEFRDGKPPPRPSEPNPDDYWVVTRIRGAAACVVVKKIMLFIVLLAVYAL